MLELIPRYEPSCRYRQVRSILPRKLSLDIYPYWFLSMMYKPSENNTTPGEGQGENCNLNRDVKEVALIPRDKHDKIENRRNNQITRDDIERKHLNSPVDKYVVSYRQFFVKRESLNEF